MLLFAKCVVTQKTCITQVTSVMELKDLFGDAIIQYNGKILNPQDQVKEIVPSFATLTILRAPSLLGGSKVPDANESAQGFRLFGPNGISPQDDDATNSLDSNNEDDE